MATKKKAAGTKKTSSKTSSETGEAKPKKRSRKKKTAAVAASVDAPEDDKKPTKKVAKKATKKKAATAADSAPAKAADVAPAAVGKVEEELSRCILHLLMKEPFFGHLLAGVVRSVTKTTPTAAVGIASGKVNLMVNPEFFLKELRKRPERIAVVKHETLHLMFKHVLRREKKRHHPLLYNLAADLIVNQFVGSPWKLPESAITLKTFPDLGLEPDKEIEWYYKKLMKLKKSIDRSKGQGDESGDSGKGDGTGDGSGDGTGQGGSGDPNASGSGGSGDPSKDQSGQGSGGGDDWAPESRDVLSRLLGPEGGQWHSDHDHWGGEALDEAGRVGAEATLDGWLVKTAERVGSKTWGNLPAPLKNLIEAALEKRTPQVDWRRAVKIFANSSTRTRIRGTNRKQSRRYGTFPGIKIQRMSCLAIGVDTSGSVSDDALSTFFSEIHSIWKHGAEVHVIECDAAVQRVYQYRGEFPKAVSGRGGTVFDPVFDHLRHNRLKTWDGCIYLTDGYAAEPSIRPPCPLLWVVTAEGSVGPHLKWGRAIKLNH